MFIWCAFLRAARENDLALALVAMKALLPYFPAGRGKIYARYFTFHVHHLESLPKDQLKKTEALLQLESQRWTFQLHP